MSDSDLYFEGLMEIEQLPLFITGSNNQLSQEIQANCVCLSIPGELQIEPQELLAFLQKVKQNRQLQLHSSRLETNLIYYIWHDKLAGQLRFNFINSSHHDLPFNCAISLVNNEIEIIINFLHSNYLHGIPWKELTAVDSETTRDADDTVPAAFTCKVYQETIFYSSTELPHSLR